MTQYNFKKILVAVDLSEASLNALDTAAALAKKHAAKLIILNVEDNSFDFLRDEFVHLYDPSSDVVSALANAIQHKTELEPEVIQLTGPVASTVVRVCMENHCDLIVMGTHGASGYRDCFVGSNTYNVVKFATCPVLTVPAQKKWTQFKKVLFPVRPVTGALSRYDLAKQFLSPNSQLSILGLSYRRQEREMNLLEELTLEISSRIKEDRVITKTAWGSGSGIAEDVLSYAGQNNADLIILTTSLDVSNKPYFIGPNAQKIMSNAKMPVLSIRKIAVPASVS